jgi:hypothetical protein
VLSILLIFRISPIWAGNSETEQALGLMMIGQAKNGAGTWDIAMNVDIDSNRL